MSNTELVRTQLETTLERSSLKNFLKADETVMLLIDTSGSMAATLRSNGKRRIDALREVVAGISGVPMIAFGGPYDAQVRFVDSVPEPDGGTPLHAAIPMAKTYGAMRVVVISDGLPDLTEECLAQARLFGGQIDVVFVGNPGEGGSTFLNELARLTGGKRHEGDLGDVKKITSTVIGLLEGEVAKPIIQGEGFTTVDEPVDLEEDDREDENDDDDSEDENDDDDQ